MTQIAKSTFSVVLLNPQYLIDRKVAVINSKYVWSQKRRKNPNLNIFSKIFSFVEHQEYLVKMNITIDKTNAISKTCK